MAKKRISLAEREQMESPIKNTLKGFMSMEKPKENETENVTNNITENITEDTTNNVQESVSEVSTNKKAKKSKVKIDIEASITSRVNKVTVNGVSKSEETRKLKLGTSTFKFVCDKEEELKRAAYHLHQDTIDKIEICSKAAGMKKAEFVDHILNAVLTEIIDKAK